ncbi:TPA: ClpP family protease [Clostridium perfringens]
MEHNKENENKSIEEIKEIGAVLPDHKKEDSNIQVLTIIGQIEGHSVQPPQTKTTKYEHMIPQLIDIEQNDRIKGILFVLNTVGGDVEAGLAIAEMIRSLKKPTVSLVIGGGHSIGVPQTFKYFNKMQERINDFIIRTSGIKLDVLKKMMMQTDELLNDMGTILVGEEAVKCGLINEVGGVKEALDKLNSLIEAYNVEP